MVQILGEGGLKKVFCHFYKYKSCGASAAEYKTSARESGILRVSGARKIVPPGPQGLFARPVLIWEGTGPLL